jgi:tripartite-type tricarboxylate transporter receptor subunit TctC
MLMSRKTLAAIAAVGLTIPAGAAEYPAKPVRIVVGFAPGGGTDITARAMAPKLGELLRQSVIVENRAGAAGRIATEVVAKAPPDGHTLLLGTIAALALSPALYKKLAYDPVKDFTPIAQTVSIGCALVVHPVLPVRTVTEFVALARARPGQLSYAASDPGSPNHLAGELFKKATRVDMVHVPYKGGGQAVIDVLAGNVPVFFAIIPAGITHVRSGKLRPVAVTTLKRANALPDVPTMVEVGYRDFEVNNWYGLLAPAGTPRAIVDRLHKDTIAVLNAPEVFKVLANQGIDPTPTTPEAFAAFIKSENAKWARVISDIGLEAN